MAYTKTAGIATTGLTSSTTLANHVAGIEAAVVAVRNTGNQLRAERVLATLAALADQLRDLHG